MTASNSGSIGEQQAAERPAEIWAPIPGYELYKLSNYGRVKDKRGKVKRRNSDKNGYALVSLFKDGVYRTFRIPRLVLTIFDSPPPTPEMHASHRDGDKMNDWVGNLLWETCGQNNRRKAIHGTQQRGSRVPGSKLTETEVFYIRFLLECGHRRSSVCKIYGTTQKNIDMIATRKTWKHVTPNWFREQGR